MKRRSFRPNAVLAVLLAVAVLTGIAGAQRDDAFAPVEPTVVPLPAPNPCPVLRAGNVRVEAPHHDVKLYFPWWPGIDASTIGDGDITARGRNGYFQPATFVSMERLPLPFPVPLSTIDEGDGDVSPIPQRHPILVVTYRFFPPGPDGDLWTAEDNGGYSVRLVEGEISTEAGRPLPGKYLGGFRVAIESGPGVPVQPQEVRIAIKRHALPTPDDVATMAVGYHALVHMFFRNPHVEIDWGTMQRTGNTFTADATAVLLPRPGPEPAPVPLPLAGEIDADPARDEPSTEPPVIHPVFRHRYDLGTLDVGEYQFVMRVNGSVEETTLFVIPPVPPVDEDPPEAELRVHNIVRAGEDPQRMEVTYQDRSGIDISTIGDGDVVVFSPCLFADSVDAIPCNWEAQRARLVEVISVSNDRTVVTAVYEIDAPRGGWTHLHNGFYPVVLWKEAVCDRLGNCVELQRLGGFEVAIDPSDPPIPAEAEVRVDPGDPHRVVAKVHVEFKEHWAVVDQQVRRVGNRVYLLATAEPLPVIAVFPPPPPPQEDLFYEIGPLEPGEYVAAFIMNRHVYDAEEFKVERVPPIPAEVALTINASDPENVTADVVIQFRTPHRVVQGTVERQGHRILLPAKAEPLPVPLDASIRPPVPVPVRLHYEIGALPPGAYLGAFLMNEFPYAVEDFVIDDPGPPIEADVAMEIDQSDRLHTVARVKIRFHSPHVIVDRDLHRRGNHFLLEATARPILPHEDTGNTVARTVVLEYPLGALEPGDYGASFVMNGWPYARAHWTNVDPYAADVEVTVEQLTTGSWIAHASVHFENPRVRIVDPGEVVVDGDAIMIDARAVESVTTEAFPPGPQEFDYRLGALRPGAYRLVYSINGHLEEQVDFFVRPEPPIPAEVDLKVDTSNDPVIAIATVQFRDHYRIAGQAVTRIGNLFILDTKVDGPLPILAPIPPPPIDVKYELGSLPTGDYIAEFRMNGHAYDVERFRVQHGGFEAKVDLKVDVGDEVLVQAVVDIDDPFVIVTDPGRPVINGNRIEIRATASQVEFFAPPSGDPQEFEYNLGSLDPGRYSLVYYINGEPEAQTGFAVPRPCDPLPHVVDITISQGDASWFSEVVLALVPGQHVTDWGEVRRDGNVFHVSITVECVGFPEPPLIPVLPADAALPAGMTLDDRDVPHIGEVPIRLVRHTYVLGILDPGEYGFIVHSRGQAIAKEAFEVPGSGPEVELSVANITEATDEHRFGISYHDPDGLDHESIMNAEIMVHGPDGYREVARLLSYASTDDDPSTHASARYAVHGPGGSWDRPDNGRYCISVDPEAIRDLNGHHIAHGRLGCFHVRIAPDPPEPGVNVSVEMTAAGTWAASVEIISEPGEQVVADAWGPVIHHGLSFVALAAVHTEPTSGPVEPLAHTYDLGALLPGEYLFIFTSNEGHFGMARFIVPGLEADPIDSWQMRAAVAVADDEDDGDGDGVSIVGEYFFALDPNRRDAPRVRAEIVNSPDGRAHLGVRIRRLNGAEGVRQVIEASRHLDQWDDVSGRCDLVEHTVHVDGTEEVLICLEDALVDSPYNYVRVRAVREQN